MNALLMHSPLRPMLLGKFDEIISWVGDSEDHSAAEKRRLISYAYALKSNEDLYSLDKMGANIKRAYDLFKIRREYEAPKFPWTMYAPSVFCLIHRRGHSMQTENAQFTRYQHMYTEMLNHGKYAQMIFTGEMKYYQGDLTGGLELLSAAATFCSVREQGAIRRSILRRNAACISGITRNFTKYSRISTTRNTRTPTPRRASAPSCAWGFSEGFAAAVSMTCGTQYAARIPTCSAIGIPRRILRW